eukprot:jgi/Chrzof1/4074/Cz13g19080.t1
MGKGGRQRHTSTFVSTHYLHVLASYPIRCLSRQVLGIPRDADSNAINRAYTQKKYAARGNDSLTKKIEAAHSQLMMSALTARLKGKAVNKDIRFADQEPLFPWRPKRWDATPKVVLIIGALQLAMIAYGFQAPNMSKVVGSGLIGIAGNVLKQNAISPPPKDASMAPEEEQGRAGKNFVRGALLGIMATFGGVLLFSFPEILTQWAKLKLPDLLTAPGTTVGCWPLLHDGMQVCCNCTAIQVPSNVLALCLFDVPPEQRCDAWMVD